jgi:hypothetical protein
LKDKLTGREWQRDNVEPYPEHLMEQGPPGTIYGVLREIYGRTEDEQIRLLARIATSMAKKIASKLRYYHDNGCTHNHNH